MTVPNFMSKAFSYQDLSRRGGGGVGGVGALCARPFQGHDQTKILRGR